MTASVLESPSSVLIAPEKLPSEELTVDVAMEALKAHFGLPVITYDAELRKDYSGDASAKVECGGAMIVNCTVLTPEGFVPKRIIANKDNFEEIVLAKLGAIANAKWADKKQKRWVRDISRNL